MLSYRLAPQVYACATDDGAILLDVEEGAYVGLDPDQTHALSLVVETWPCGCGGEQAPRADESDALELARVLCERGLLVPATQAFACERAASPDLPRQESELIPWCEMSPRQVRARHVFRFLRSVLTAALLLRFASFAAIVDRVRRRRHAHGQTRDRPFDLEAARNLLSAYSHLRPVFYGQKGRCLLDSLALLEFLACDDLYPTWVIGVKVHPFGSHSWVQYQSFILNGTPAYARSYKPILVV